ncbi:TPA: Bro-N domain-containing protein [Pseudomonas aeruginosa]|nr:Bro-N domain-containing protein [Pseudomonas aeruginosa]
MSDALLHPSRFTHHHRVLRAVLLDEEGWFVLSDLARLLGRYLGGREPVALCDEAPLPLATAEQRERLFALCHALERHLDTDQWRLAWLHDERHGPRQDCLVSESGLYALLWLAVPGAARGLRRWVSGSVLPRLRSQAHPNATPQRAVLHWKTAEIDTLHWQGKTWIPLCDCPQLLDSPRPLIRA